MVVARQDLEMLRLHLRYMSTGLSTKIVSHWRLTHLLSMECLTAAQIKTEMQVAHL
jgi:hypothetical protein